MADATPDWWKYHGLGNDYLVLEPARFAASPSSEAVRRICDRHRGVGSDGVLWGPLAAPISADAPAGTLAVRIFNPDGSEAEKSGNGLRIFARHVRERGHVRADVFPIDTLGGRVEATVLDPSGRRIAIDMGRVRFDSASIPMTGPPREVLREPLAVGGRTLVVSAANVGNPHCVVLVDDPTPALAREIGPLLERHPSFPARTNVQLAAVVDPHHLRITIWERGAGYTEASGTSSCAAAAVAVRLGLCASPVAVDMPGGVLDVALDTGFRARLEGDVAAVASGRFAEELLASLALGERRA
jgi:diaminopimelate epimerase